MKLVTFNLNDDCKPEIGAVLRSGNIIRFQLAETLVNGRGWPGFDNMLNLIRAGSHGLDKANSIVTLPPKEALVDIGDVRLLSPLPRPEQIRDFMAFEGHAAFGEDKPLPNTYFEQPIYYKANRFSVVGDGCSVYWPEYSKIIDYELELAIVIGLEGKNISKEQAGKHIFGYMVFNDLSARDAQSREMALSLGPAKGKDFDGGNVLGPYIVTPDEIDNVYDLRMTAHVNGELWSDGNTSMMTHKFEDMIAHVSQCETIFPGEVMGSGTVTGGCGLELGKYPQVGDSVMLEIEQVGKLTTRIISAD